jgi:hypothetical protein
LAIAFPIKLNNPKTLSSSSTPTQKTHIAYPGKKFTMNYRMTSAISLLVVALLFSSLLTASARHGEISCPINHSSLFVVERK